MAKLALIETAAFFSDPAPSFATNCRPPRAINGTGGLLLDPCCSSLEAFVDFLDRATRAASLPEWAAWLCEQGMAEGLIEALPDTKGTYVWKVHPTDEDWLGLISEGIRRSILAGQASRLTWEIG